MLVLAGVFFPQHGYFFMILTRISYSISNLTNLNFIFKLHEIQLDKKIKKNKKVQPV